MTQDRLSKEDWKAEQKKQRKVLEMQLDGFLSEALASKASMDELTAHYRISGLYGYSFYNSLLIKVQGGTICQSYAKWKKLERLVNKGEHSRISVLVPMFVKERTATGEKKDKLIGFKLGKVFDIKQTSGKELEYDHNTNGTVDYAKVKKIISELAGAEVVEQYTGTARGWSDGKVMTISSMSNDVDKTKTLIHEYAHHVLHTASSDMVSLSKETKEVEAESVAHLVSSYLGLDYELTTAYVSAYKNGIKDARTTNIIRTADKIIKAINK